MRYEICQHCTHFEKRYLQVTLFLCLREPNNEVNISKIATCYEFTPKKRIPLEVGKL